jgi:hypothetical protein
MAVSHTGKHYRTTREILTQITGILIIIPLAPFICRFIQPVMLGEWNIDLILAIIVSIIFVRMLTWLIKPMVFAVFIVLFSLLLFNQFRNRYTFYNVLSDYKSLVKQTWTVREQKEADALSLNPHLFENVYGKTTRLVKEKVQYQDSVVRNFSVKYSLAYFKEYELKYGLLTRYFSLFKYINVNFKYVPDAQKDEYYAAPRETILNGLGGDCDDHSILMASCMMSIGARCRIVIVDGHMYPEMYVGDKKRFDVLQQAIIQLFQDYDIHRIYYHENNGDYWINLDYTADYPGGPYMNDKVRLVIEL